MTVSELIVRLNKCNGSANVKYFFDGGARASVDQVYVSGGTVVLAQTELIFLQPADAVFVSGDPVPPG